MDLKKFAKINRARCEANNGFRHRLGSWSLSEWMLAVCGEAGEAANIIKKLNRVRDGIPGNTEHPTELQQKLADELADVFCYLDLTAQAAGIDLSAAIAAKFKAVSDKIGYNGCPGHGSPWFRLIPDSPPSEPQYMVENGQWYRRLQVGEPIPAKYQCLETPASNTHWEDCTFATTGPTARNVAEYDVEFNDLRVPCKPQLPAEQLYSRNLLPPPLFPPRKHEQE